MRESTWTRQQKNIYIGYYLSALDILDNGMRYTWREFKWAKEYVHDFQRYLQYDDIREEYKRRQIAADAEDERVRNLPHTDPRTYLCVVCKGAGLCGLP